MADVTVEDQGSLVLFKIESQEAQEWVDDNIDVPDFAWLGGQQFVVEHRFADNLIAGLQDAGFEVE